MQVYILYSSYILETGKIKKYNKSNLKSYAYYILNKNKLLSNKLIYSVFNQLLIIILLTIYGFKENHF